MRLHRRWAMLIAVAVAIGGGLLAFRPAPREAIGQGADPKASADEAAIRAAIKEYGVALAKGDLDGVLAFWADDADFVDDAGNITRGKAALTAKFKESLPHMKGSTYSGKIHSVKFLRPEICMVDGTLDRTTKEGVKESGRYAVVWTKTGDKWLISNAHDLPLEINDLPSLAAAQLNGLEWLVGDWVDDTEKIDVALHVHWATNKAFLLMDYKVKREGAEPMEVTVRVGWDGAQGRIRSWMFDSQGGFGEAFWTKDGKKWLVGMVGVLPDGGTGGSTNIYEFVDANTFIWRATDRDVDGQPLADAEVKFVRKPAAK
jgi:uncharacterized protein (TIGR02246 family)